jgi:hypothetical protein
VGAKSIGVAQSGSKVIKSVLKGGEKMPLSYKDRLLKEINEFPEESLPKLYRVLHGLRTELMDEGNKSCVRGSLKGIWKGSQLQDDLFLQARKSLFPYEGK